MKRLFSLLLILCSLSGLGQPVVQRAGQANTVNDPRHMASLNEYLPTYNDTTEANLPAHIGIDSAGAVIYTYDVKGLWYRQHAPKKWVRLSPYWNLGFGLTAPNDYTVEADTAALATLWDLNQAVTAPGLSTDTSGRTYYVANGLAARNDSTHILGGTLDEATTIALNGKAFTLSQENGSYTKWNNYSNSFPQWEFYHRHTDGSWTDMYNYSTGIVTGIVASAKRAAASGQVQLNLQSMNDNNYALLKTEWSSAAGYTSFGQKSAARDSTTSIAMYRSFGSGKGAAARLDSAGIHLLVGDATFLTKGVSVEQGTGQVLATSLKTTATAPVQVGTTKYVTTDTLGRLSFADGPSGAGTDTSGHAMIWAQNGLSKRNDSTTILGGTLDELTTITTTAANYLKVSGPSSSGPALQVVNTSTGVGVGVSSDGPALTASSTGSYGGSFFSSGNIALNATAWTDLAGRFQRRAAAGMGVVPAVRLQRDLSDAAAAGMGVSLAFAGETTAAAGTVRDMGEVAYTWTTVTDATRASTVSLSAVDNAATYTVLTISGAGVFTLVRGLPTYSDNAAAIAGGLQTNQLYKTATGQVMIVYAP